MKEVGILDTGIIDACLQAFEDSPVIMIQFPEVFGIVGLPNQAGVDGLNKAKNRLPAKFYGTVIGNSLPFFKMEREEHRPDYLPSEDFGKMFEGSIVRIRIGKEEENTPACLNGTHQALLYRESPIRDLFRGFESAFEPLADHGFFLGHSYSSPFCTSANMSGHPDGSITNLEAARAFGKAVGIPLLVRCSTESSGAKGSFPVLSLEKSQIVVERDGPGLDEIIARFEPGLFQFRNRK
jgi:hypothetical protein